MILIPLVLAACEGGGVAGAGFDNDRIVQEANEYPPYVSSEISESVEPTCDKDLVQQFENMFSDFAFSLPVIESTPVRIDALNATVTYRDNVFTMSANDKNLVTENLPAAFYMHPISLGGGRVDGREVIVIASKSRATAGLYFVAIYDSDGLALYKKVLGSAKVWDVALENEQVEIRGGCETRRIRFAEPNKLLHATRETRAREQ